jgi:hypothetical protein
MGACYSNPHKHHDRVNSQSHRETNHTDIIKQEPTKVPLIEKRAPPKVEKISELTRYDGK